MSFPRNAKNRMTRPLKRSEIEEFIDWTRVGPEELSFIEQLDGATNGDYDKILRELTRRGALYLPEESEDPVIHATGGDPASFVQGIFGRFFAG